MADPAKKLATYDDLFELPDNKVGQIIDGVLHAHPRPAPKHAQAASTLGEELGPPFKRGRGGPGGWLIFDEPEVHLGADIVVPDLAGWHRERLPERPKEPFFKVAPDWVCEVLSPSTAALDRGAKRKVYEQHAVKHIWFVDPEAKTLEVFELTSGGYRLLDVFSGDAHTGAIPFDAIELDLSLLWSW